MERLVWRRSWPGRFVARPAGEDWNKQAVIHEKEDGAGWGWAVYWPRRFAEHGAAPTKQAAADAATEAWWRGMEIPEPEPEKRRGIWSITG